MTPSITFHDLSSQKWPSSWSPFTIRTTLCLNFLSLPYTHNKISYPDIASTLSSLGVNPPPSSSSSPNPTKFTLPAVSFDQTTIMGSMEIASHLATLDPTYEKSLFPQRRKSRDSVDEYEKKVLGNVNAKMDLGKHVIAFVPLFLDRGGIEYFYATREPRLGNLETLRNRALEEEKEEGFKGLVKEAVVPILEFYEEMGGHGDGEGGGVFAFGGGEPQFIDFCVVGMLQWWICARGEEEIMKALEEAGDGRLAKIMKGCEGLLKPREA